MRGGWGERRECWRGGEVCNICNVNAESIQLKNVQANTPPSPSLPFSQSLANS